jgi:anti-sigma-K factor RskA
MSAPPAADHSDEQTELAALYALRVLDGDDLGGFERHLGQCLLCQATVARDRWTVRPLTLVPVEMAPRPEFRQHVLEAAATELAVVDTVASEPAPPEPAAAPPANATPAAPIPFRPRRRPWLRALAAVLAVLVGVGALLGVQGYQNQVVASVALQGTSPGSATVLVHRSGAADLQMNGLAPLPGGKVYQAWVIPQGGQPISAGVSPTGQATLPLPGSVQGTIVALTVEDTPGAPAPTQAPFLAAPVTV